MDSIIFPKNFDLSKLVCDESIKTLDTGSKMKYISYNKKPFHIQIPECLLPYGITNQNMDDENAHKYAMDVSLRDPETRECIRKFKEMLQALDDHLVQEAFKNQKEWLKKVYPSKEVVEALYTPMLKYSKDKDTGDRNDAYPPTFKMKLPYAKDKLTTEFFDYKGLPLDGNEVIQMNSKGARVIAIAKCNGLWFAGGKFGCSWKAVQVQILPKVNTIGGCAIKICKDDSLNNELTDDDEDSESDDDF